MHADPADDDFFLNDDLARIDGLLPLWQRFGPEEAEERRVAACHQFLELVSEGAADNAPRSAIERLLAVNLVVVQAAALNCLQRDLNTFGPEGHGYLRQGARLMELCLRLANALAREQKSRRREAREAEASATGSMAAEPPEAAGRPDVTRAAAPPRAAAVRPSNLSRSEQAAPPAPAPPAGGQPPPLHGGPIGSGPPGRAPP